MTETQYPTPDPDAILRAITSEDTVERAMNAAYVAAGSTVWNRLAMRAALTAVADALRPMLGTGGARWRHKKRGTTYVELHRAELQHADPRFDCLPLVVYQCEKDGRVWVRPVDEFEDGRFEPAPPTQEPR